jgi:hypothetical protein
MAKERKKGELLLKDITLSENFTAASINSFILKHSSGWFNAMKHAV